MAHGTVYIYGVKYTFNEKTGKGQPFDSWIEKHISGYPYCIKVNRKANTVTVYTKDYKSSYTIPVKAFVCSTGRKNATHLWTFKTFGKSRWRKIIGGVYSQYATDIFKDYLFHAVPDHTKSLSDLMSEEFNKLGRQASAGCVRLTVCDAKWIFDLVAIGTKVTIYDGKVSGSLGKPIAPKINLNDWRKHWDPTDPHPNNPW